MKMNAQKSIVLKQNFKNLMSILLPIAEKVVRNQINQIKSRMMCKIRSNKVQNTLKRVSNRGINEKTPIATKPKIAKPKNVDKPPIATKPKIAKPKNVDKTPVAIRPKNVDKPPIATKPKIAKPKIDDKPEIATKPKITIKPKNVNKNYDELKNRVIKQLKKHFKKSFDVKKSI